jgi:hypothetical protein
MDFLKLFFRLRFITRLNQESRHAQDTKQKYKMHMQFWESHNEAYKENNIKINIREIGNKDNKWIEKGSSSQLL